MQKARSSITEQKHINHAISLDISGHVQDTFPAQANNKQHGSTEEMHAFINDVPPN